MVVAIRGFPGSSDSKESACSVGDLGSVLGLGRSPEGGHGSLLQYSNLENPHRQRNLGGYSPWGHQELDMTATKPAPNPLDTISIVFTSLSSAPWTVLALYVVRVPSDLWKMDLNFMSFEVVVVAQLLSLV